MLRFRVGGSPSIGEFVRIGRGCTDLIVAAVQNMGGDINRVGRVLDFGCGCGRTSAWFIRDYPNIEFYGTDVDAQAVAWCQANLSTGNFITNRSEPPLPYPDQHFGMIYCLSVFTHLNENMQDAWLADLRRLLKPNGFLVITVHGANATAGLSPGDLETLRSVGFLHKQSAKLHGIMPEWYHTTWHSQPYIRERLAKWFPIVRYEVVSDGLQDIIVAGAGV